MVGQALALFTLLRAELGLGAPEGTLLTTLTPAQVDSLYELSRAHDLAHLVVVDVGIHRTENGLCGDVDFDDVKDIVAAISPVPGGVGKMTTAMLMKNCVRAAKEQLK